MTMRILSQEELKSKLHYNPVTGIFTRLITSSTKCKIGDVAGSLHSTGYNCIIIDKVQYKAHRLAWLYMTGLMPFKEIDHINGIKNDNRWVNLRNADRSQNCFNKGLRKDNKSGYKGVSWDESTQDWKAQAGFKGKNIYIGRFKTALEAYEAYKNYAQNAQGKFYKNLEDNSSIVGL